MLTRRRLYLANTDYNIDLSDHGNPNPGTPVTLWKKWEGGTNQTWRFEEGTSCLLSDPRLGVLCLVKVG